MVAPSFQSYELAVAEPFEEKGKMYVVVIHPNTKNKRKVRWYTESEYAKQYGTKVGVTTGAGTTQGFSGLKAARGFSKGPILLIRNWKPADEDWLSWSNARYAVDVGWHIVSTEALPQNYPEHFRFISLSWDEFSIDETHMKSQAELSHIILKKEKERQYVNKT